MNKKVWCGLLIFSSLISIILGCKKDNGDYLGQYSGSYVFTIITRSRIFGHNDTTYTTTFNGQISSYVGDLINANRRLSINFGEVITPQVLESGKFVDESTGGIYSLSGLFSNKDNVSIYISRESAGFSTLKDVQGHRQ
jgi:hypothetical protein